ncbi:MAG: sugar phosphate isomerase/epimerase [Puniceicoccales bacterium]|jgi:hydroxypyruvate isomerase|nr:sugar phosphate isomerase/epimerase [Puniceicoccales bacterium]
MNRRHFLQTAALAAGATTTAVAAAIADAKTPADTSGSFLQAASPDHRGKLTPEEFASVLKRIGAPALDLLHIGRVPFWQKLGIGCSLAHGATRVMDGYNKRANHARYIATETRAIEACAKLGVPNIICFSGRRNKGQSDEEGLEACAEALRTLAPIAEKAKVTLVMELLNSTVNQPGYQADHTAWGVELAKRVGSERFKLLYDIYHMQIMEGNIIRTIRANYQYIGHYHTAGVPTHGEFEPNDDNEVNYAAVARAIRKTGFRGYIGHEYSLTRDPEKSIEAAVRIFREA